jgi:sulfonate transport system substrate-binding protein
MWPYSPWKGCSRSILGALLLLSACAKQDSTAVLVLRVGDQQHMLETLLAASGEGSPSGYRIEWSNFLGGPAVLAAQTGGSIDVGWMYETPLVFAQAAGSPIKVIAAARPVTPGTSALALVVAPNSPVHEVTDLKGHTVGFLPGTVTQYLLVRLLQRAGMSLSDVRPVTLTSIGPALLDNGTVDAAVTVDPYLSQMLTDHKARIVAIGGEPLTPDLQYIVASKRVLSDPTRVAAMGDLVKRFARGLRHRQEHPDAEAPVYAQAFGFSIPVIEQYLKRAPARATPIDSGVISAQQTLADTFLSLGLVTKHTDASELFDHRYDALITQVENP